MGNSEDTLGKSPATVFKSTELPSRRMICHGWCEGTNLTLMSSHKRNDHQTDVCWAELHARRNSLDNLIGMVQLSCDTA